MIVWFLACSGDPCDPSEAHIDQEAEISQGIMQSYCTSCHSAQLTGKARYGAPPEVNFDSLAGVRQWSAESAAYIQSQGMPPGGGMSEEERNRLSAWLECGALGQERFVPEVEPTDYTHESHNIVVFIEEDPEFANTLLLRREVDFGGSDLDRVGPWTEELYQIDGEEAWLVAYSQYIDANTRGRSVFFDPPLPILQEEDSWAITVEMYIQTDSSEEVQEVFWEGFKSWGAPIDGQRREAQPFEIRLFSEQGEEWGWQFSSQYSISAQWVYLPSETAWTTLQYAGDIIPGFINEFPIKVGIMWLEHLVED